MLPWILLIFCIALLGFLIAMLYIAKEVYNSETVKWEEKETKK